MKSQENKATKKPEMKLRIASIVSRIVLRIVLRIGNGYGLMESLRVCGRGKCVESSWKVRGYVGVESARKVRGYVGVESAWKVRGMWAWKVRVWCEQKEGWVR